MEAIYPVTGVPVLSKPEWTDVHFGNSYRLTVKVIGDNIVYSQPRGTVALPELEPALEMIARIVTETIGDRRPHVQIADYTYLKGVSSEARRHYIDFMASRPNLVGAVFYGVSPTLRMSIKLGRRLHLVKSNIALVDDFEQAMERANQMLHPPKAKLRPLEGDQGQASSQPSEDHSSQRQWVYQHAGFELRWEVIDRHVIHGSATGLLRTEHIEPVFNLSDQMVRQVGRHGDRPALIIGIKGLEGVSVAGRRRSARRYS